METIIRKFNFLDSEQYGDIVKMIFEYCDTGKITGSTRNIVYFEKYIKSDVDFMLRKRRNTKKSLEKKKENRKWELKMIHVLNHIS